MVGKIFSLSGRKKYVWAVVVIFVVIGGYYWHAKSQTTTTQPQYVTGQVEKGTVVQSVSTSGNVVVDQLASVDPTISGTVENLSVNVGDSVKKGQALFDIKNDQLSVSAAQAVASLQQSQNSLKNAKISLDQARVDYKTIKDQSVSVLKKNIAEDKVSAAKDGVMGAEKSYAAAQESYNNQISTANERHVVSPISGTVNEVNIKNGDDLGASSNSTHQAPIIVGDLTTMKVQVQVNEVDIPNISVGQRAILTFDAIDSLSLTGKVEKMDSLGTVTQGVVTYNVVIGLDTIDPRIKPGMSATAAITTQVKQDVLMVPNSAVKSQGGSSYVEVLSNGAPQQKLVEVGISNDMDTEIVNGLNAGDLVITQTILPSTTIASPAASSTSRSSQNSSIRIPGLTGGGR